MAGLLGGAPGWELSYLLSTAGATGIDVGAALRPETHHQLSPANLALVQSYLGPSLRDLNIQMLVLALGTLLCTAWLPGKSATIGSASESASEPETTEPELIETGSET